MKVVKKNHENSEAFASFLSFCKLPKLLQAS